MSKDISSLPTSILITFQNIVAGANQSMDTFATELDELLKQKKLPKDFVVKTNEELFKKVEANNQIIMDIDNEVLSRMKKTFPTATTGKILDSYVKKAHQELQDYNKKSDKPKPDLKIKR